MRMESNLKRKNNSYCMWNL